MRVLRLRHVMRADDGNREPVDVDLDLDAPPVRRERLDAASQPLLVPGDELHALGDRDRALDVGSVGPHPDHALDPSLGVSVARADLAADCDEVLAADHGAALGDVGLDVLDRHLRQVADVLREHLHVDLAEHGHRTTAAVRFAAAFLAAIFLRTSFMNFTRGQAPGSQWVDFLNASDMFACVVTPLRPSLSPTTLT